jgi:hypothetical protein
MANSRTKKNFKGHRRVFDLMETKTPRQTNFNFESSAEKHPCPFLSVSTTPETEVTAVQTYHTLAILRTFTNVRAMEGKTPFKTHSRVDAHLGKVLPK